MRDISGLAPDIASKSSQDGRLDTLVRSSGMVTIESGIGTRIFTIRVQASVAVRPVREFRVHYYPRQIVRSNIMRRNDLVAAFIMASENELAN